MLYLNTDKTILLILNSKIYIRITDNVNMGYPYLYLSQIFFVLVKMQIETKLRNLDNQRKKISLQ